MPRDCRTITATVTLAIVLVSAFGLLSVTAVFGAEDETSRKAAPGSGESSVNTKKEQGRPLHRAAVERELKELQQKAEKACSREDLGAVLAQYRDLLNRLETGGSPASVPDVCLQLGRYNLYLSQYDEAETFLDRALQSYESRGSVTGKAKTLSIQVVLNRRRGQLGRAANLLKQALQDCGRSGSTENQARCLEYMAGIAEECAYFQQDYVDCSSTTRDERSSRIRTKGAVTFMRQTAQLLRAYGMQDKAEQLGEQSLAIARGMQNRRWEASALEDLAHVFQDRGQYDRAFVRYLKAMTLREHLNDTAEQVQLMNKLGRVLLVQGKNEEAKSFHEKALDFARAHADQNGEAVSLGGLGSVYQATGDYAKAEECDEKALAIFRKTNNVLGESYTLDHLGNTHFNNGQYAKAAECYEQSLAIRRNIGYRKGEALSLNKLGTVYQAWGQQAKALTHLEQSLEISRDIGDVRGEATSLNALGEVCRAWGQFDKALEYLDKSLEITRKIGDVKGEATSLINQGKVLRAWGQYDKALACFEKSVEMSRNIKDAKSEAAGLNNLGRVLQSWGQYDKALECYRKSLDITRKIGDVKGESDCLKSMGIVSAALGKEQEAGRYYEQVLEIEKKLGVSTSLTNALLAQLYIDMGDVQKAEAFVQQTDKPIPKGRLLLLKSDFPAAKKLYEGLLKKAEAEQHWANLFVAHTGLGMAMEGMGNYTGAAEHYRQAIKLTEKERDRLTSEDRETYFDVKVRGIRRTAPYEGMARVLVLKKQAARAFTVSELSKARAFAEAIARKPTNMLQNVPEEVRAKSRKLADRAAELESRREKALQYGDRELLEYLQAQIAQSEHDLRTHRKSLRDTFPVYAATRYPTRALPVNDSAVRENEWVLSYDATDSGLLIYLVHGKRVLRGILKPIKKQAIEDLVRRFRTPLVLEGADNYQQKMDKLRSFDFAAGKDLSDLLLKDVLPDLPAHVPVIVIPDDSLSDLPFEMLVLNDGGRIQDKAGIPCTVDTDFFGDRNPVSYYQSVTALTLTRTFGTHDIPSNRLLVVADPVTDPYDERVTPEALSKMATADRTKPVDDTISLLSGQSESLPVRLPQTKELAEHLAHINQASELLMGFDASKRKFLKEVGPRLPEFKHIIFATHGSYGSTERGIKEPVLCLTLIPRGTDGLLRMSEVMGLKLNADLVALTACQSGLGKKVPGEGIMGMGRAFQYAGARSVLMSLWSVQATASTRLVETLYRKVMEGHDKLEALTLARKEIRENGFDHPFFWAGLILAGETN